MLASLLSLSRLFLALWAFYEVYQRKFSEAAVLIAVGALTDLLDGWVARSFGQQTRLGAHLDHLVDKFFVLTVLLGFYLTGTVDLLPLLLLAFREVSVSLLRFYGLAQPVNVWGKVKTSVEFLALFFLCLDPRLGNLLLWVAVGLAYLSAALYLKLPIRVGL
ncbi:MAG: CDP-alcohol phosphatidyltransferase family protein [Aquificae bacterium]|nr:CDP-alcohol phosphatidyltransferase family protein [Aquificota bacterium]